MPQSSRSRRAAARQSQLGQRKKRQQRGPAWVPPAPAPHPSAEDADQALEPAEGVESEAVRPATTATVTPPVRRRPEPRPAVYAYVGPELKRIFVLSGSVLVVLVALSFVLR